MCNAHSPVFRPLRWTEDPVRSVTGSSLLGSENEGLSIGRGPRTVQCSEVVFRPKEEDGVDDLEGMFRVSFTF